jgi:ABC-2 type transport system ATP-binding protein
VESASGAAVDLRGLRRVFGELVVLDGIDLRVGRGETVALLGRNGAGKSTLLRIVATTLLPTSGGGTVAGHDLRRDARAIRARCGVTLADERAWYWRLSGRQNLEFFGALFGLDREAARQRAGWVLDTVELSAAADRPFGAYSTGMRLRMSVGRALLPRPEVLLLDEPTRSVDLQSRGSFHALLRRLVDEQRVSVVLATHDLDEAAELADRVLVIAHGRVAAELIRPDRAALEAALQR